MTRDITRNCKYSNRRQQEDYLDFMKKLQEWSIVNTETGDKVNKGVLFAELYHSDKDMLKVFTSPVTEDGLISVEGYRLVKRNIVLPVKPEDDILNEKATEVIRDLAVRFMFHQKNVAKDGVISFTYDKLIDLLSRFGKSRIYDKVEEIGKKVDEAFI